MEIFIILVVGSIIYSVIQGAQRGKVTPEQRKLNPTILESARSTVSEMADSARKTREASEFKFGHCAWFGSFELFVSYAIKRAKRRMKTEEELAAMSIEHRKLFDEYIAKRSAALGLDEKRTPERNHMA